MFLFNKIWRPEKIRAVLLSGVILGLIIVPLPSFAAENSPLLNNPTEESDVEKTTKDIQIVDTWTSRSELIVKQDDKAMLAKNWYSYQFEVDMLPSNQSTVYPIDQIEYQRALDQVTFPLDKIGTYKVYFLNYKLKNYPSALALSFLDDSVVVFGSYYDLTAAKVDRLAVHELGHLVDFKLMKQEDWQKYLAIRGLTDETKYNNWSADNANRPQEIFAEDFRMLFGGEMAQQTPHLNQELPNSNQVQGLKEFFLSLGADFKY